MQWGTGQSQSIFRPTNHKRVMPANLRPCLIPHWQSYYHQARTVLQSMTTGTRPREFLRSCIKILHIWTRCTNLRFMIKNKKWSFQNLQVASDVINLKIISVKMPIWITKMLKSLIRSLCAYLIYGNFKQTINSSSGHLTTSACQIWKRSNHSFHVFTC